MMNRLAIPVCLLAACCGRAISAPPPPGNDRLLPLHAPPAGPAPSLWCDNVVEMETSRRSGVTNVWLGNGVRVHHLKLGERTGQVVVTIALSGGNLLEDGATRGLTEVAAGVLDDWDVAAPTASAAERMAGRDIRIDAGAGPDAITIRLAGSTADAGAGMRVVRELLTDAKVAPESVDAARDTLLRELRARDADARAAVTDAINLAIGGAADARLRLPEERILRSITPVAVREWLARHARENGAPIEVAVVGDLTLAEALRLLDDTLGTLPSRPRVQAATNRAERTVIGDPKLIAGPFRKGVQGARQIGAGRATVVCGCVGPEMGALAEQRSLRALVRVAIERIKGRVAAPELGMVAGGSEVSGGMYVSPFVGRGMVLITATVDAAKTAVVSDLMDAELARLASEVVPAEELEPIARELGKTVGDLEREPRYWSAALARCDGLGIQPDEVASGTGFYRTLTPERLRDEFKKFWREEGRIALTIRGPDKAPVAAGSPKVDDSRK